MKDAIATAVQDYRCLVSQGGVMAEAAFGAAAVTLQQRLNTTLTVAAMLLFQHLG